MPCCTRAGARLPGPLAPTPPLPPPLGGQRLWVLAQLVAPRPQLRGGGDLSSSGGRRARGAGGGGGRRGVQIAFSVLQGHGRAGQQGRRPPRREGCLLLLPLRPPCGARVPNSGPATLAAAAPRPAASSPPRAPGGGRRSAPRPACCGRRAGESPRGGGGGASLSPLPWGSGGSASAASPALGIYSLCLVGF